jgi:hypothetical protein
MYRVARSCVTPKSQKIIQQKKGGQLVHQSRQYDKGTRKEHGSMIQWQVKASNFTYAGRKKHEKKSINSPTRNPTAHRFNPTLSACLFVTPYICLHALWLGPLLPLFHLDFSLGACSQPRFNSTRDKQREKREREREKTQQNKK